jgi:hypothetical protein
LIRCVRFDDPANKIRPLSEPDNWQEVPVIGLVANEADYGDDMDIPPVLIEATHSQ